MSPTPKSGLPAPTLALIVMVVMAALYGVDKFLAAQETAEMNESASSHFAAGKDLLKAGKPHQAVEELARAHTIERGNRQFLLSLAEAQMGDNQLAAARATLDEALEEDSNDGHANLLMARLMARDGHIKDADSYYHRAIYGEWPAAEPNAAEKVRLELARMLAEHGNHQELLSELLLLQNEPSQDMATRKEIAALFLRAGSADHAIDAYRNLIRDDREDADTFVGLGQAEILAGNYHAAENAFLGALRRRLDDPRIQSQLKLVANLATLDPTVRRLRSAEKYRRSEAILEGVQNELNACSANPAPPAKPEDVRGPITNEMAEARLDEAEKLWKRRQEECNITPPPDDPLPLIMKKLSSLTGQ